MGLLFAIRAYKGPPWAAGAFWGRTAQDHWAPALLNLGVETLQKQVTTGPKRRPSISPQIRLEQLNLSRGGKVLGSLEVAGPAIPAPFWGYFSRPREKKFGNFSLRTHASLKCKWFGDGCRYFVEDDEKVGSRHKSQRPASGQVGLGGATDPEPLGPQG